MSKMKATDKQAMEILKKLDELIDFSVDLEANLDESETIEEVLLCLEDTIDEFCDAVEVIEAIREFLIEVENLMKMNLMKRMMKNAPAVRRRNSAMNLSVSLRAYRPMNVWQQKSADRTTLQKETSCRRSRFLKRTPWHCFSMMPEITGSSPSSIFSASVPG